MSALSACSSVVMDEWEDKSEVWGGWSTVDKSLAESVLLLQLPKTELASVGPANLNIALGPDRPLLLANAAALAALSPLVVEWLNGQRLPPSLASLPLHLGAAELETEAVEAVIRLSQGHPISIRLSHSAALLKAADSLQILSIRRLVETEVVRMASERIFLSLNLALHLLPLSNSAQLQVLAKAAQLFTVIESDAALLRLPPPVFLGLLRHPSIHNGVVGRERRLFSLTLAWAEVLHSITSM